MTFKILVFELCAGLALLLNSMGYCHIQTAQEAVPAEAQADDKYHFDRIAFLEPNKGVRTH